MLFRSDFSVSREINAAVPLKRSCLLWSWSCVAKLEILSTCSCDTFDQLNVTYSKMTEVLCEVSRLCPVGCVCMYVDCNVLIYLL